MAGRGPAPKAAHLRQRRNKKPGAAILPAQVDVVPADLGAVAADQPLADSNPGDRPIPNPDDRIWHPLTIASWSNAWRSPMASRWLETDADALGRLAILWDEYYKHQDPKVLGEIRLQEQRFGLSPLDRSRLAWEISRADEVDKPKDSAAKPAKSSPVKDPRAFLRAIK